jgi:hypothetical protein
VPSTATGHADSPERVPADGPVPFVFEALAAVVTALGGLAALLGGSVVLFVIDRATLSRAIDAGVSVTTVESTTLTDAAAVELAGTALTWTGTGLVLAGVALLAFAGSYLVLRHRTRRGSAGRFAVSDVTAFAVIGSAAAAVLSFVPGSAGLGGVVAGYLRADGARRSTSVGALSGLLLTIPAVFVAVFALGGLSAGLLSLGFTDSAALVVLAAGFIVLVATALNVGLGALGGYVGGLFGAD